jgi:2-methylcitrate dehydratase PrpD
VPAAVAAGSEGSGEAAAIGMLAGYEFLARSGAAAGRGFHRRGFHATGVLGPVAAALVAGIVTGADDQVIVNAMGLAGSMSSGLLEFLADATWSKRLHPGWAAHGGLVAVQLAAAGFTGPASVLEGKDGVFAAFLDQPPAALDEQLSDLGERWACLSLETKLYPCAHVIHPYLDLLLTFGADQRLDPHSITGITCQVAPWAVPIVAEPLAQKRAPRNEYEARASLPFALAVAVIDGSFEASSLGDEALDRPEVLAVAAKIDIVENGALDKQFPARLEIRFSNGDIASLHSATLRAGDEDARLREKFDRNLGPLADHEGRRRIWDAATGLADGTTAELAATCASVADDLR